MVSIYGMLDCPYCMELKDMFINEGIDYKFIDIDLDENKEEFDRIIEISKAEEVPIIKIGKQLLIPNISFKSIKEGFEITKSFL